jgi:hypothetical protein
LKKSAEYLLVVERIGPAVGSENGAVQVVMCLVQPTRVLVIEVSKSLSENRYVSEKKLSTSQMQKGQIGLRLLFPTNQAAAGAIEPGMAAFYHPSALCVALTARIAVSAQSVRLY